MYHFLTCVVKCPDKAYDQQNATYQSESVT